MLLVGGSLDVLVAFLREGPSSQAACNFTIVIVMAALLVGWRGVVALGVPCVALVLGAGILVERGLLHPIPPTAGSHGVFALMQMSSLIVMLVIFDRVRLRILRAHRQLETKLLQAQRLEAVGRLRSATARMLRSLGHRVIECAQPAEARAIWRSSAGEIDVVVSDVILPGVTGPRLVAELLASHPVRVLFISGYLDDALKDPLLERAAFLPKPFSPRDLETKLAAVLAAPPLAHRSA